MDRHIHINNKNTFTDDACKKAACTGQGMLSDSFINLVGGFSTNNYWSSSENNANNAWKQNFNNGNQNNNNKNNNNYVRCVRTFNQSNETDARNNQLKIDFDKALSDSKICESKAEVSGHLVSLSDVRRIELAEIFEAYFECRSNKRNTASARLFELDYENRLCELHRQINSGTYEPGRSIAFIVNKPVKREIFAASFTDRVVHHLVIGKLNPYFEKHFIFDSYACRKGKGTHFGIQRAQRFIRAATNNYTKDAWILKLDIEAFFMNIDKDILYKMLYEFIEKNYLLPDKSIILELCRKIIFSDCRENCFIKGNKKNWNNLPASKSLFGKPLNKGIPIGNLTSQVFANFYLSALDHFVKHELNIKYYGRYVDDIIIVHNDREYLKNLLPQLYNFLLSTLQLSLHPKKTRLQHFSKGITFLGCFLKPNRTYINKRTKSNFYSAIKKHNEIIRAKKLSVPELKNAMSSINSYLGIMKHYDTYKLRKKMLFKNLSAYFFNHLYISSNYGKMIPKIKIVKHKPLYYEN